MARAPRVMVESEELAEISTITLTFSFTFPPESRTQSSSSLAALGSAGDRKMRPADPLGDPSVCSLKPRG